MTISAAMAIVGLNPVEWWRTEDETERLLMLAVFDKAQEYLNERDKSKIESIGVSVANNVSKMFK